MRLPLTLLFLLTLAAPAQEASPSPTTPFQPQAVNRPTPVPTPTPTPDTLDTIKKVVLAAKQQIGVTKKYDPDYTQIPFPNGDVPMDRGVCTDVVVRAFRAVGVDLQVLVNADMKRAWARYPKLWNLSAPDPNIDHRRVPNLMMFFDLMGKRLRPTKNPIHYPPGDVVVWKLSNGLLHIGLVSDEKAPDGTPLIIHNIGAGTQQEDILFKDQIIGHYRWWR